MFFWWICSLWHQRTQLVGVAGSKQINACLETIAAAAPVFPFGLGCIRPVDADLVPLALLTTRTTVKGPLFCELSTTCLGMPFPVMEVASYNHFNPTATISSIGMWLLLL